MSLTVTPLPAVARLGFKGAGAASWLRQQGINVPEAIYETRRLADGLIVRLGGGDFFLEGEVVSRLGTPPERVYVVERQDSCYLIEGPLAHQLLAQMSSFDFRTAPVGRVVLTRAAGVNCTVLPEEAGTSLRLWVDVTFAAYLSETLAEIMAELTRGVSSWTG